MAAALGAVSERSPYEDIIGRLVSSGGPSSPEPQRPAGTGSAVLDTANAAGTGYNRGMLRLAGLPVDTVANVLDLGKAGIGSAYTAITGKAPPSALELTPRSRIPGSGDWMIEQARRTAPGAAVLDPVNPEYEGGYSQAIGGGLNAVINPQSRAQLVNQAILGMAGAAGARLGAETGNPAWAVVGGLTPAAAQQAGTAGVKYAVRGGEQGRRNMEQRTQDLRNAGIDNPTLGLASGNKVIGGMENILQSTPGAVGVMSRARDAAIAGLRSKTERAADMASMDRGATESGMAIQSGIRNFKDNFKASQGKLYDKVEDAVGSQFPTKVDKTRATLEALNEDIPGAPAMSQLFKNSRIKGIQAALEKDVAGDPAQPAVMSRIVQPSGTPFVLRPEVPGNLGTGRLPFEAIKKTRTLVGNEIADASLVSDVPRSKWNPLYGALSDDMQAAAQNAGPAGERAFNRANTFTRSGMKRLDRVAPFAQATAPEQAFSMFANTTRENLSTLQAVKKSLPQDARGQVAGTIIERLGKATPGQQNDTSTAWSPETFLTNWNRMSPRAREELFSGFKNAPEVKAQVESVAQATSMMRDSSKMWANPSGTGANLAARGLLGAVGVGGAGSLLGLVDPTLVGGVATGLLGANLTARALTSQGVRDAMLRRNNVSPGMMLSQPIPLLSTGLLQQPQ